MVMSEKYSLHTHWRQLTPEKQAFLTDSVYHIRNGLNGIFKEIHKYTGIHFSAEISLHRTHCSAT